MSVFVVSIMAAAAKMNIFAVHNTYEKEQNSLYLKHTGRETFSNKKGKLDLCTHFRSVLDAT